LGIAAGAALVLAALLMPTAANAGVATYGAVLLDPFNPVPEIQFRHNGCYDGCERRRHRHHYRPYYRDCDDGGCAQEARYDQSPPDGYPQPGYDQTGGPVPPGGGTLEHEPCIDRCHVSEHWERNWRNGDRIGQEWYDKGYRERDTSGGHRPKNWDQRDFSRDGDDDDAAAAAAPPPPAPPAK
jgi:hypothetical protein